MINKFDIGILSLGMRSPYFGSTSYQILDSNFGFGDTDNKSVKIRARFENSSYSEFIVGKTDSPGGSLVFKTDQVVWWPPDGNGNVVYYDSTLDPNTMYEIEAIWDKLALTVKIDGVLQASDNTASLGEGFIADRIGSSGFDDNSFETVDERSIVYLEWLEFYDKSTSTTTPQSSIVLNGEVYKQDGVILSGELNYR